MAFILASLPNMSFAQAGNQAVADEIIKMVKDQWAAQDGDNPNVAEGEKNTADDYTEFNGAAATRVDGKAMTMRFMEVMVKDVSKRVAHEMLNPKVQVYGDAAILTYNFMGMDKTKDGSIEPARAKSTRVYVKQGGKWKLVHANFAPDPIGKM